MEPISTAASVLTLLGAAAGTIKFIHDTINSVVDAPNDIKRQGERLGSLSTTLASVVHACEQLPDDCPLDLRMCGIGELIKDSISLEAKIKTKRTRMMRNKFGKFYESCTWLLSDREFKRFFESLDQWNTVLLLTLGVIQMTFLKRIFAQTSSLTSLPHLTLPTSPITPQIAMRPHFDIESQVMVSKNVPQTATKSPHTEDRRFASLVKLVEPVGVLVKYQYRMQGWGVDLALSGGNLIIKRWSHSGKENHITLVQSEGQQLSLIVAMPHITRRRLKLSVAGFRLLSHDLTLNFRWTIRCQKIVPRHHPSFVAIEKGDLGYIQNEISSKKLCLSDCVAQGNSLLHYAVRHNKPAIVAMLIDEGFDVNVQNDRGETPLHAAVQYGLDSKCARLLLENGADALQQDIFGRSALHYFYNEVVRQLLLYYGDDIDPWMQDLNGMTVLHWASWSRKSSRQALTCFPHKGGKPLCYSVKDAFGMSTLHYAVQRGNTDLIAFLLASPEAASMSMPKFDGITLLHHATESGRPDTINTILERGFDLDVIDNQGRTVLHHAAMRGNLVAAQRLIELGAIHQLDYKDNNDRTPADVASHYNSKSVLEYFESLGHSSHESENRDVSLPPERKVSHRRDVSGGWKIAVFVLLVLGMMYWRKLACVIRGIGVVW